LTFFLPPWFRIFDLGPDKPHKIKKPTATLSLGSGPLGAAILSDGAYMGAPPLPRRRHMDMQHIIINWLSLCSELAIFGSVFIVPIRYEKLNLLN